jgi:hypothetical protein
MTLQVQQVAKVTAIAASTPPAHYCAGGERLGGGRTLELCRVTVL